MRVVVVVQARMGSSRLPGKVLLPVAGAPLLQRMLERVLAAEEPDEICVATTLAAEDDPIRELARSICVPVVSGHPTDLIERHLQAGRATRADVVVKVPSDCPLIDPAVIDCVLARYRECSDQVDFVTNLHPPSWPDGNDVEVIPMPVLETAWREATRPLEREHTTPFIWERPDRFRLLNVVSDLGGDLSKTHRFTIDYPEDHRFIARVFDELWSPGRPIFSVTDILALLAARPDIVRLNARWAGQSWHLAHLDELASVTRGPSGLSWNTPLPRASAARAGLTEKESP
ncbi:MAG TPA: glycosyltransferase family protein [Polyangiaceae bacterium]|nr:glycosyltransferase family protein [Polyangiaceae bacterium]